MGTYMDHLGADTRHRQRPLGSRHSRRVAHRADLWSADGPAGNGKPACVRYRLRLIGGIRSRGRATRQAYSWSHDVSVWPVVLGTQRSSAVVARRACVRSGLRLERPCTALEVCRSVRRCTQGMSRPQDDETFPRFGAARRRSARIVHGGIRFLRSDTQSAPHCPLPRRRQTQPHTVPSGGAYAPPKGDMLGTLTPRKPPLAPRPGGAARHPRRVDPDGGAQSHGARSHEPPGASFAGPLARSLALVPSSWRSHVHVRRRRRQAADQRHRLWRRLALFAAQFLTWLF